MYVVTFYSFKGGTGRSMALMNVAAELLAKGRKVLLVDFDLEAPGLDTFPMMIKGPIERGLIEMIGEYLGSAAESTPTVSDFVYSAEINGLQAGSLWIMPSGRQGPSYDQGFKNIDWLDLYQNQGGFLFFEDLKVQWKEQFDPDYVLIDSRTGHTDIGGICTRQLPNAVVAMFYPNEQNLRGLMPVVNAIRAEELGPLKKKIDLHFVMGNVPDLDDEDRILAQAQTKFSESLGYDELSAIIHHLASFSMLSQSLAVLERPKSKIAAEYRSLTSAIVNLNLEDRTGALALIGRLFTEISIESDTVSDGKDESRLQFIRGHHWNDAGVIRDLARLRRAQRRTDEALELFERVLALSPNDPGGLFGRAEVLTLAKRTEDAVNDLETYFTLEHVPISTFPLATRLLMINDKTRLAEMTCSPAIRDLPSSVVEVIVMDLLRDLETCEFGVEFASRWLDLHPGSDGSSVSLALSLCLIAVGKFQQAKNHLTSHAVSNSASLPDSFNYAMAEWGSSGILPRKLFQDSVIPKIPDEQDAEVGLNRLQCYALAYWATGDLDRAQSYLAKALEQITDAPQSEFSAWTYLYRSAKGFKADLYAMNAMLMNGLGRPDVFERAVGLKH